MDEQLAGHVEGLDILRAMMADGTGLREVPERAEAHRRRGRRGRRRLAHLGGQRRRRPIEADATNYFQLRDGKIAYMANFHDTVPFQPFLNQKLD